ncbi:hypothetical protein RHMOL_Rhmol12G0139800 [Rhododendron molle]|uniref:Uncharacterized protein n=1 Tax=Rhododendron molle TaxID=49168 RepID=A0ACC0LHR6_RHOML|nr:hypothetical protein RHMOL_Rhmol12G0139800 [Rhododendron molle]
MTAAFPPLPTEASKLALLLCLSRVGDKSGRQSKSAEEQKDWRRLARAFWSSPSFEKASDSTAVKGEALLRRN